MSLFQQGSLFWTPPLILSGAAKAISRRSCWNLSTPTLESAMLFPYWEHLTRSWLHLLPPHLRKSYSWDVSRLQSSLSKPFEALEFLVILLVYNFTGISDNLLLWSTWIVFSYPTWKFLSQACEPSTGPSLFIRPMLLVHTRLGSLPKYSTSLGASTQSTTLWKYARI